MKRALTPLPEGTAIALTVPVRRGGHEVGVLKVALGDEQVDRLTLSGAALDSPRPGVLEYMTTPDCAFYLDTEGTAAFGTVPASNALPLAAGERARLRIAATQNGDPASLWVIEYEDARRLRHTRSDLGADGGVLDIVVSRKTTRLRVAVRCKGRGTLELHSVDIEAAPLPAVLAVRDGAFTALGRGARISRAARRVLPAACPEEIPAHAGETPGDTAGSAGAAPALAPIDVALTVDTEDAYFTEPRMLTGAGIGEQWGMRGILDVLAERALNATFFVNVFEAGRQPAGALAEIVGEIADRGHEIALHSHPSPDLPWYDEPLFRKSRHEQAEILGRGRTTLQAWSGQPVSAYRAGGYAMNDDTLAALGDAGIAVDSSVFFPSPNNRNSRVTVNAPRLVGAVLEVPVTYVIRTDSTGRRVEHRKLDLDWLTPDELGQAVVRLRAAAAPGAVFMMHSFSFLEKATRRPEEPPSPRALFRSEVVFNRYVEVYGPKPQARANFEQFLDAVRADPHVRLGTLASLGDAFRDQAAADPWDIVPVVVQGAPSRLP